MADEQNPAAGGIPRMMQEFVSQLRGAAERLENLTGLGESIPSASARPGLHGWPTPGTFSAAQLTSIATGVTAQRQSIAALKTQLTAFEEQLVVLERMLEPLAEWSRTWAELEERFMHMRPGPASSDPPDPPG
jgi:hypothetical protein